MEFTEDLLKIDAAKVADEIAGFIRDRVKGFFKRKGAVIGLSGGIDSAAAEGLGISMVQLERARRDISRKREATEPLRRLPPYRR